MTETTKPVSGASTKETVKTIAQGRPDVTGEPVATLLVCFFILHAGLWVRTAHPAFPAPSVWAGESFDNSGTSAARTLKRAHLAV
jgi:hypothetical protein